MGVNDKDLMQYVGVTDNGHLFFFPAGAGKGLRATLSSITSAKLTLAGDYELTALDDDTFYGEEPRVVVVPVELMSLAKSMLASAELGAVEPVGLYGDQVPRGVVLPPGTRLPGRPPLDEVELTPRMVTPLNPAPGADDRWLVTYVWTDPNVLDEDSGDKTITVTGESENAALREAHVQIADMRGPEFEATYRIVALARESEL